MHRPLIAAAGPAPSATGGRQLGHEAARQDAYPVGVALYRLDDPGPLIRPALVVALDGWVDAGSAATTAAALMAAGGRAIVTFDADRLFDYRARRPTLEIEDGRLADMTWPDFEIVLVRLTGATFSF